MDPIKRYSLEDFAERHRADFDLHEPRPELWEALTTRLETDQPSQPQLRIVTEPVAAPAAEAPAATPTLPQPRLRSQRRWQVAGLAAALVALLVAAGLGEAWKSRRAAEAVATLVAGQPGSPADAVLYLGDGADALPANQGGANGNARLDTAVHGMERYYAAQLADRQEQLSQLVGSASAEWTHELASLDSSYQVLKQELPRHPQPEVVLTAMNRNLQIRLDILDRQLELRGTDPTMRTASTGSEYPLADSRRSVANNMLQANAQ